MKYETKLEIACKESQSFGLYAQYILEEEPTMSMPQLRELYKHNASVSEYRAHMERIKGASK